jgi:hypothetical protein
VGGGIVIMYLVKNFIEGQEPEYFVTSQETVVSNPSFKCVVGSYEDAVARQKQVTDAYLIQEKHRFTVVKEINAGDNVVWEFVENIETETHDGAYQVFNTITGMHEKASNKEEALNILNRIKNEFIVFTGLDSVKTVEKFPSRYGEEKFGVTVGEIPVEVM